MATWAEWLDTMTQEQQEAESAKQKTAGYSGGVTPEGQFADATARRAAKEEAAPTTEAAKETARKKEAAYNINTEEVNPAIAQQRAAALSGIETAKAAGAATTADTQSLVKSLQDQAAGKTESLAAAQLKATGEKNLAQQLATAGASRGGNAAALQRQLAKNQMATGAETTQQAGQLKLQEQTAAQNQLASVLASQQSAAIEAQSLYQTTLQNSIASGLSVAEAQQKASQAYQEALAAKAKETADRSTAVQVAQIAASAQTASAETSAKGQSIWNILGFKDGGIVPNKGFAKSLEARKSDSYKPIMKKTIKAYDGYVSGDDEEDDKDETSNKEDMMRKSEELGKQGLGFLEGKLYGTQAGAKVKGMYDTGKDIAGALSSNAADAAEGAGALEDSAINKVISRIGGSGSSLIRSGFDKYKKAQSLYTMGKIIATMASDENVKKNIKSGDKNIEWFLKDLESKKRERANKALGKPGMSEESTLGEFEKHPIEETDYVDKNLMGVDEEGEARYEEGGVADDEMGDFLSKLKAYSYEYKNPNKETTSEGEQNSVMAQDLEKTKLGKNMVEEDEDGTKIVNYGKGFGTILAAQANLNKRLEAIEKKKRK